MPDPGGDPGRSILFGRHQNPELAAEAREMSLTFADFAHLRRVTGEEDPERAWEAYFAHTQPQLRGLLDGLLGTFPPEDQDRAAELAGSVEAFVLPSGALESRVFASPQGTPGHLIGISPAVVQLTAEIAWGLELAHPYEPEALPRGWEAATMHAQESLALNLQRYVRALEVPDGGPVSLSMLDIAMRYGDRARTHARGPRDFYDAAMAFALAHELAHLDHGDLLSVEGRETEAFLSERLTPHLRISDEENEELRADAATFTACFNYFVGVWLVMNKRPTGLLGALKRFEWDGRHRLTAWHSARRATEACEAYYSAIMILSDLSFRRGDDGTARRLMTTGMRLPYIQQYVQRMREEVLAPSYGPFLWEDRDVRYRKAHHSWRVHFVEVFLPHMCRHQRSDAPDWVTELKTPADLFREAEVLTAMAAEHERQIAALTREKGADDPEVLSARGQLATLRAEAGDHAGAVEILEALAVDAARVAGPDDKGTLGIRHNLAWLRAQTGDTAGAAAAFRALCADQERVFGPDDPEVLDTRYELAWLQGDSGDAAGAVAAFTRLCADYERVLGPGHAATLATRRSLAQWRERQGDMRGAAAASTEARAGQYPVFSPDHPGTLPAYEQRLTEQERAYGPGDPNTLTTRWFLGMLRAKEGDAAGAADAFAGLLDHDLGPLGFDDVDVSVLRGNVEHWRTVADRS
ncbi:tetratricopeptide repeat protein [Streptomyces nigra]|uniref:tetratricopeptide repeat protein n=1 Tax=Streptomyces nigra TaxID=1827580 RepID=UPI0035D81887